MSRHEATIEVCPESGLTFHRRSRDDRGSYEKIP